MDIIEKARELGKLIQQEESYIALQKAQADADADMELQNLIGDFNMKRMSINNEASKKDKDSDKLALLNSQMREDYSKIMSNKNMIAYNEAKDAFDMVANRVLAALFSGRQRAQPLKQPITRHHHAPEAAALAAVAADRFSLKGCKNIGRVISYDETVF